MKRSLAAITFAAAASSAFAADEPSMLGACRACHGPSGVSAAAVIPNLAGQKEAYLMAQLQAFRSGERKNPLMAAVAAQLADADIGALAQFWSRMPAAGGEAAPGSAALSPRMRFPAGFPRGFVEYERIVEEARQQVVLRYASAAAWDAARAHRPLPDGAAIVVATYAMQLDAQQRPLRDAQGRAVPGAVVSYAAMQTQAGWGDEIPALLRNGDWHYAVFDAQGTFRSGQNQAACLACHRPEQADDFVFTRRQLEQAASASPPASR